MSVSSDSSALPIAKPVDQPDRELTPRVLVLGLLLSVVMGAANVYVGLKAGMTVSASIPAAVMAMLLFRMLFRNSTIREANQVQTCASAGESLAAGIIFTMPALIIIGFWDSFDFWTVTIVAFTGGLLGILFMIPMRRVFVVGNKDLAYPEGLACAAVLQAGDTSRNVGESAPSESGGEGVKLFFGGLLGAAFKLVGGFLGLISGSLEGARIVGTKVLYFGGDLSPMLVAVGYIVRLNVALLIFIGGSLAWLIGIPLFGTAVGDKPAVEQAYDIWSEQVRFVGVGAMVLGGFSSLISVRAGLLAAISELWGGLRGTKRRGDDHQRDIPSLLILVLGIACTALLAMVNYHFTNQIGISALSTSVMLLMGFFFTAVASYIVGLVGNSNSPVSGMTITAVLVSGGLLWLFGFEGMEAMVATLGIAAVVCCVACTSGDVCNDLKTGSIVGAAPHRQQLMQIAGVFVAAFVMAPILNLLHNNTEGGIGGRELPAPQANLFAQLARGFSGEGELPWDMIGIGVGVGAVILIADTILKVNQASFRLYLMPIAVGMYLPFGLATPILIGGLLSYWHTRNVPAEKQEDTVRGGILFSSGVIAGEALTAVGIALFAAFGISSLDLPVADSVKFLFSVAAAVVAVVVFQIFCRPQRKV